MLAFTPARRSELRAKAHALSPVVMIGDKGLTATVVAEVDRALKAHELIKVKAATDDRGARVAWMTQLCEQLQAHPVQLIGKILVIWREDPDKVIPKAAKPAPAARKKPVKKPGASTRQRKKPRTAEELIRTARRQSRTPSPLPAPSPRRRRPSTSR